MHEFYSSNLSIGVGSKIPFYYAVSLWCNSLSSWLLHFTSSPVQSHRSRASRVRQHVHCDSCYSRRCRTRVEVSVSCAVIPCRLHCGALFHLCKEEDHLLLCPNVRVPCLNAEFGCPVQLPRSSRAAHLQVCPASVVSCSMEWLRWLTDDTNPHNFKALQDNVLKEREVQGEALELAMALVDQSDLYSRLKMKPLYPELMEEEEEEIQDEKKEETAVGGIVNDHPVNSLCEKSVEEEAAQNIVEQGSGLSKEKYNMCELMFSMEKRACAVTEANLENPKQNTSKTGLAPWQDGVLERLGKELTPHEYNMYVVHHGRMLVAFGQMEACTPRDKDFVYGSLEPIPVQTLHSFTLFTCLYARPSRTRRVHLVDTSDLGANEENVFANEAAATLLGYAEREVMGHKISESKAADGLYVDIGTQTHSFSSAPFKRKTTLSEVMVDKPLELHLQLQAESVNSRHHRASSVFTFICGHTFHRREFATHFRNVHSDIQTCLSGWFEQRCPLAYLGCTYSQRRFQPSTLKATVTYNKELRSFNLRPTLPASQGDDSSRAGAGEDSLSSLPYEVLCHMASFLDSQSLSQLALVSQLMRQVCSSLLQDRGMVTLRWEKDVDSHRQAKWRAKPVWEFSHLFSSVDSWHMADIPPISAHLKVCPYYEASVHSERIALPSMTEKQGGSQERASLVNHFTENRRKQ
uniref:F-box only protein 40-like n=1 Tax=Stegastes partitus TaxID=144197 RepID=A0A3B5AFR8_9TELE